MQPQVTFRGLFPSQAIVDTVWRSARELGLRSPSLSVCHVVVELVKGPSGTRSVYRVSVRVREPERGPDPRVVASEDVQHALRDAFAHAARRLSPAWQRPRESAERVGRFD